MFPIEFYATYASYLVGEMSVPCEDVAEKLETRPKLPMDEGCMRTVGALRHSAIFKFIIYNYK